MKKKKKSKKKRFSLVNKISFYNIHNTILLNLQLVMQYHIISIFPEIFDSFLQTSLIWKAQQQGHISCNIVNPRDFCTDKHQQIDDTPYGWWTGMLLKAPPIIKSIKYILQKYIKKAKVKVILLSPSQHIFCQKDAHHLVENYEHIIFLCWRYEGIDHRVNLRCQEQFQEDFAVISLGKFVTMWWEVPSMMIIEATARLLPQVIKEKESWKHESYRPEYGENSIEYPQYTRPQKVEWFPVPDILLSWNHAQIEQWRKKQWK